MKLSLFNIFILVFGVKNAFRKTKVGLQNIKVGCTNWPHSVTNATPGCNKGKCCANKQTKRGTRIVFIIELRFQELVGVDLKRDTFQK